MPTASPRLRDDHSSITPSRGIRLVTVAIEVTVLAMVCWSPWPFGSVHPAFEYLLYAGVALSCALWAMRNLLEWRFTWIRCPAALCLLGLVLIGIGQLVSLPREQLRKLAPMTANQYDRLLPARPELLPGGEAANPGAERAGTTISLFPAATRDTVLKLLAVLLLFAVVRNNLCSSAALWRLSMVTLINGSLLSLFALLQFLTSPHNRLFWRFELEKGQSGFGAFICRNHFPFYVNMCIGLGLGLLLFVRHRRELSQGIDASASTERRRGRSPYSAPSDSDGASEADRSWFDPLVELLQNPAALWIISGLAIMLASVLLSLSRGAMLALLGAGVVCLAIRIGRSPQRARLEGVLLVLVLAGGVAAWFGLEAIESRVATVLQGDALEESRGPLWLRLLPVVRDYPVFGTGYGTFSYVEPTQHAGAEDPDLAAEHAHNDYLEALIEGGALRLSISLVAIGVVFWMGYRAVRGRSGRNPKVLALGALFGFVTIVLHSIGDFGLHIPAIAVLAVVLTAQLLGQGQDDRRISVRLFGLGPLLGATSLLTLALLVNAEGWRAFQAERLRLAAAYARVSGSLAREKVEISCLETAVRLAPENATLQVDLAEAHFRRFRTDAEVERAIQDAARLAVPTIWVSLPGLGASAALQSLATSAMIRAARESSGENHPKQQDLLLALRGFVLARDYCPLLAEPHVRLAALADHFKRSDSRLTYLERARFLRPTDAEILYACGRQEFAEGRLEQAWRSWHRCLEISERRLFDILDASAAILGPAGLMERILPDKPELLIRAAAHLYPDPQASEPRKPFREKALALLEGQPSPRGAEEWHERALMYRSLNRVPDALAAYREALARKPGQVAWRFELALFLTQQKLYADAEGELRTLLDFQPSHAEARNLLQQVVRAGIERN